MDSCNKNWHDIWYIYIYAGVKWTVQILPHCCDSAASWVAKAYKAHTGSMHAISLDLKDKHKHRIYELLTGHQMWGLILLQDLLLTSYNLSMRICQSIEVPVTTTPEPPWIAAVLPWVSCLDVASARHNASQCSEKSSAKAPSSASRAPWLDARHKDIQWLDQGRNGKDGTSAIKCHLVLLFCVQMIWHTHFATAWVSSDQSWHLIDHW